MAYFSGDGTTGKKMGEKVLIVEDDKTLRHVAVELFKALGYETLTAEDAVAALRVIQNEKDPIDYVFSDVVMPRGMNGVELAEQLKQISPTTKVLLASGYPFEKIENAGQIDEKSFISKPYRAAQLIEKMEMLKSR